MSRSCSGFAVSICRLAAFVVVFAGSASNAPDLAAGTIQWTGSVGADLRVSGVDVSEPPIVVNIPTLPQLLNGEPVKSITKSWEIGLLAEGEATAKGEFRLKEGGTELNLGVEAFALSRVTASVKFPPGVAFNYGQASVNAKSEYADILHVKGDGIIPFDPRLVFRFKFDGVFDPLGYLVPGTDFHRELLHGEAGMFFIGNGTTGFVQYYYNRDSGNETNSVRQVSATADFFATLDDTRVVDWNLRFSAIATAYLGGSIRAGFQHTATLVAVEFADGTTPEERGFTLEFESGLTSPNLVDHSDAVVAAAPEPASMALWMCGAAIAVIARFRPRTSERLPRLVRKFPQ